MFVWGGASMLGRHFATEVLSAADRDKLLALPIPELERRCRLWRNGIDRHVKRSDGSTFLAHLVVTSFRSHSGWR
jgi:hypothetical protein